MLTIDERKLLDCLPIGSKRPLTSGELKRLTGFDRRKVCALVASLRIKKYAIGARRGANKGYYLMTNEADRTSTVNSMRAQAKQMLRAASGMEKAELADDF